MLGNLNHADVLDYAQSIVRREADAVRLIEKSLDFQFLRGLEKILQCDGRIVVTGVGKSGLIGRKISATLASTGTSSFFMHPAEAAHGDLGMLLPEDCVLAISNSGESEELNRILPSMISRGITVIGMTCDPQSTLAQSCVAIFELPKTEEVCPLKLAPTSSAIATLAMGDSLAMCLMKIKGFSELDFARSHPGGSLGARLVKRVDSVMIPIANLCLVNWDATVGTAIECMTRSDIGIALITNEDGSVGLITDGDLRRGAVADGPNFLEQLVCRVATLVPKTIQATLTYGEALTRMEKEEVDSLVVVQDREVVGLVRR